MQTFWQNLANLDKNVILELCKGVHCVDLGESFPTHIFLQNFSTSFKKKKELASVQPRTSLVKFARSPRTDPPGCYAQEQHRCDGQTYGTKATIGNGKVIQHRARLRPSSIKNLGTSRTLRCRALDSNCIELRASFTYMSSWTFDY